jgi:rhodanese-related sulfurtransferase
MMIHSFIHLFIHSFIHSFIYSFIHSIIFVRCIRCVLVDVREEVQFAICSLPGSINLPLKVLQTRPDALQPVLSATAFATSGTADSATTSSSLPSSSPSSPSLASSHTDSAFAPATTAARPGFVRSIVVVHVPLFFLLCFQQPSPSFREPCAVTALVVLCRRGIDSLVAVEVRRVGCSCFAFSLHLLHMP